MGLLSFTIGIFAVLIAILQLQYLADASELKTNLNITEIQKVSPETEEETLLVEFQHGEVPYRMCLPYIKDVSSQCSGLVCLDGISLPKGLWRKSLILSVISECFAIYLLKLSATSSGTTGNTIYSALLWEDLEDQKNEITTHDPLNKIDAVLPLPGEIEELVPPEKQTWAHRTITEVMVYKIKRTTFDYMTDTTKKLIGYQYACVFQPVVFPSVVVEHEDLTELKKRSPCKCDIDMDPRITDDWLSSDDFIIKLNRCIRSIDPFDNILSHFYTKEEQIQLVREHQMQQIKNKMKKHEL